MKVVAGLLNTFLKFSVSLMIVQVKKRLSKLSKKIKESMRMKNNETYGGKINEII